MEKILIEVEKHVSSLLRDELPHTFIYHNLGHTKRVVKSTKELIEGENIKGDDAENLLISAWFHDVGYTKGCDNHEDNISHFEGKFYIVTNWKAKNFRLMETPVSATSDFNWTEVIPHRDDVLLEDIDIFRNYLVVSERKNGLAQLKIITQYDDSENYREFDEDAYYAYNSNKHEFNTVLLRCRYTSLTNPNTTYD